MFRRIKVFIRSKDRSIIEKKVGVSRPFFIHRNGFYSIPVESANITSTTKRGNFKVEAKPELLYVESYPLPITFERKEGESSGKALDDMLIENAVKQLAKPKWMGFELLTEYLKDPYRLLLLVFVGVITYAMLMEFLFA